MAFANFDVSQSFGAPRLDTREGFVPGSETVMDLGGIGSALVQHLEKDGLSVPTDPIGPLVTRGLGQTSLEGLIGDPLDTLPGIPGRGELKGFSIAGSPDFAIGSSAIIGSAEGAELIKMIRTASKASDQQRINAERLRQGLPQVDNKGRVIETGHPQAVADRNWKSGLQSDAAVRTDGQASDRRVRDDRSRSGRRTDADDQRTNDVVRGLTPVMGRPGEYMTRSGKVVDRHGNKLR
jgi:hypothetical protein